MAKPRRIRTPLRRYFQFLRLRLIPLALWLGAVALVVTLWNARVTRMDAPARVDALRQATLASVQTGMIVTIAAGISEEVKAGQALVRLDDTAVRAELGVAEAELKRLQAELPAAELRLRQDAEARKLDYASTARTYAVRMEQMRLQKLTHLIDIENEQVNGERLAALLQRQKVLQTKGIVSDQIVEDLQFQLDASRKKTKATREAVALIEQQVKEAQTRERLPEPPAAAEGIETALAPLRRAIDGQAERINEIQARRKALVLASPIDGVVTAVYHWEGESVRAGDPILMVADPRSLYVLSYVEPGATIEPVAGMEVEVRRNTTPIQAARARVIEVGRQFERMPWRLLGPSRAQRRWGRRVLIELPESMRRGATAALRPDVREPQLGETLFVRFFSLRQEGSAFEPPEEEPLPPL